MIRHLVHLRFRSDVDAATKAALYDRLGGLSGRIDGILDFQHRANVSVETPLVRDFLDMFWFDFRDVAVRDAYLVDEVHQAIGADIVACLEGGADGVFVCDIEV
ncbi:Dabb family protein [Mameliella sediminis]|uniref:Dabb family protein n=1 Tax=Mameliella sediminis TaxID=2836866 RepID=UPI001C46CF64|nr:Dabb family protein [Mameliella sediminis]MBY6116950.1 Dabb family protein [Antarctobacter heliothermus]MBY6146703.1 Dabb family protein [Mameliella alba]MBV7397173.1 Dabb family protein [Mameliella sediminis]MBY6163651.1 Dabb family protein [Mameliella alba]MBY6172018.1 Dabb family protein [Mameliella alba]